MEQHDPKRTRIKKEPAATIVSAHGGQGGCSTIGSVSDDKDSAFESMKDEPDFIETNCHWKDCAKQFNTQDELVKVICF